jgi:hypothetical protein
MTELDMLILYGSKRKQIIIKIMKRNNIPYYTCTECFKQHLKRRTLMGRDKNDKLRRNTHPDGTINV